MFEKIKNYLSFQYLLLSTLILSGLCLSLFGLCVSIEAQKKFRPEILITIERGVCFGSCPIYYAQIYTDGTIIYVGKDNVKVKGKKRYKISKEKVKELIEEFQRIKYFSLKNKYDADENGISVSDMPTTITSIILNGRRKQIVNYYGAPKQLNVLESKIETITGLHDYIGSL